VSTGIKVLLVFVCLFAVCALTVLILPSQWSVEQSVLIDAPPERIHPLVEDLHRWPDWAGPVQADPSLEYEYSGPEKGVGAEQHWTSSAGRGHTKILSSDPATGIRIESAYLSDEINGEASLTYAAEGDKTRVTWQGTGKMVPVLGALFLTSIEAGVADFYRHALGQLKQLAEESDPTTPPQP
jgi:hypothetical protein